MSDALESTLGVIPVAVAAGVALKVTDHVFEKPRKLVSRKAKKKNNNYVRKARRLLGA